ncbi:2-C-methyl-D-erythritol 4-phosphate cytidylyltransferase [Nocardioides houyundeii]|uniref:2-C-methyl-D-erythritol 4-phosphate cytidylyltransferase n=1 Tax=Nocardioides houyundeii TaxID=2045452 RepID=UPI000C75A3E6|nr:2-C-methyl-D-erythritol 4-phosphate cytidylyltransferase [Nocardioides houyundeii]
MTQDPYDVRDPYDDPQALGLVLEQGRGSLPFALIHGEALVACAAWALGDADVRLVDADLDWESIQLNEAPLVLHDPLCPMTPASFIATCVSEALATGAVVVGARPVTDTVKHVEDSVVGTTVDREALRVVCSPIVLPAQVVASLPGPPDPDFARAVSSLAAEHEVTFLEAPPEARRVASADDVAVLEALTADRPRVR